MRKTKMQHYGKINFRNNIKHYLIDVYIEVS